MKKVFIISVITFFSFLCIVSVLGAKSSAESEAIENATVENVCSYDNNAKFDDEEIENKREEVKKYIIDDTYVNAVLAVYSMDKDESIKEIAISINKLIEYSITKHIDKNIESYVQAYVFGTTYFDFLEKKGSNTSLELAKEFNEIHDNLDSYDFAIKALSNVSKECSFNDSGMPIKKPYTISGWYPNYGQNGTGERHVGIDFAIPLNTPMYAIQDADVVSIGVNCPVLGKLGNTCGMNGMIGAGNYVALKYVDGGKPYYIYYMHLTKPNVSTNDKVLKGQLIGFSGGSGNSSGPHAHVEIHKNSKSILDIGVKSNTSINPCEYIKGLCE